MATHNLSRTNLSSSVIFGTRGRFLNVMENKKNIPSFMFFLDKTKKIENGIDNEENICAKTSAVMSFSTQNPCEKTSTRVKLFGECLITQQKKDRKQR